MPIPETTSAEAFDQYVGGEVSRASRGTAWKDIRVSIITPEQDTETVPLPAVSEAFLAWTMSGEAEFSEREGDGPWVTNHIRKGSMFLTSGGAPYECRWRSLGKEPLRTMAVFIALPLQRRALVEVYGAEVDNVRLRDLSAFNDETLHCYMEQVHDELMRKKASPLLVQGLAQSIAVYLARNYSERITDPQSESPSLPGFKVRQITDTMARNLAEDFSLEKLAAQARLSRFHFSRLFKVATGLSPSRYHLDLRLKAARRLLRETDRSIIEIALDVGYRNPGRFAQLFRREAGMTPSEYRRRR